MPLDRAGRVLVEPDLSLPGLPEVFALGDMAAFLHQGGAPLPGVSPVAMQMGRHAARCIRARLAGRASSTFVYTDRGTLATIGRSAAVAKLGRPELSGRPGSRGCSSTSTSRSASAIAWSSSSNGPGRTSRTNAERA